MALGTPLSGILAMLRAEARLTQTVSAGLNSDNSLRQLVKRTQELLWLDTDWPHLRIYRDITTSAGQRYYAPPSDLDFNRIYSVKQKWNELWRTVHHGIEEGDYNLYDPELDRRTDPVIKWQLYENEQIELWPLPATDDIPVRFHGVKNLSAFTADTDIATLDDHLIVLTAAAELLASTKATDAKAKQEAAQQRYRRLLVGGTQAQRFNMRGRPPMGDPANPYGEDNPFRIRVTYARAG